MRSLSSSARARGRLLAIFVVAYAFDAVLRGTWPALLKSLFALLPRGMVWPMLQGYHLTLYGATAITIFSVIGRALGARKGSWALVARRLPRLVHVVVPLLPGSLWFFFAGYWAVHRMPHLLLRFVTGDVSAWLYGQTLGVAVGALMMTLLARAAVRRATLVVPEDIPSNQPVDPRETVFSAVAVTWVTRGVVAGLAVLPVAFIVAVLNVNVKSPLLAASLAAYLATAFGSILVMRRVSRIKVGIDGVYVMGSGPATFYAWSNVDEVRAEGVDIVLATSGRAVLRLQLHGEDATRRDALVGRFGDAMLAAARTRNDASHVYAAHAASEGGDKATYSSRGVVDYRKPAVQREQLWEVVEGSAADPSARILAAKTLATELQDGDHPRLRIAANHCADPKVRIALEALLDDAPEDPAPQREPLRLPL